MLLARIRPALPYVGLVAAVLAAYANHFRNDFHADDRQAILENPAIERPANIPRFFTDPATGGAMSGGALWRPLTTASLAIDYWLAGGRKPFWFHLSTFVWFLVQLILMALLFRRIMDLADPHPSNRWTALAAAALYGLHPAAAETINYITQRADLYNTLGVVASLLWFIAYPGQRKRGWYLLPAVAAYLAKAPALIFPLILIAYLFLFEQKADKRQWRATIRAALPALAVTVIAAVATAWMTPPNYQSGAASPLLYRLTQPWAAAHYFRSFFLPTSLSADQNWPLVASPFSGEALAGYAFAIALAALAVYTSRRQETRPVAFGMVWFFLALLPTSLLPLRDPANDHRMFFPFVGLALAVVWSARLLARRQAFARSAVVTAALVMVVLAAEAAGTHARNNVWRTDESLWQDAIAKNPDNPAGMMNLALAYSALGRDQDAALTFQRAVDLHPDQPAPYFAYGRWLKSKGHLPQARWEIEKAVKTAPFLYPEAREVLMQIYAEQQDWPSLDALVRYMLHVMPDNQVARRFAAERTTRQRTTPAQQAADLSPEALLNRSAEYCKAGKYQECLDAATEILQIRPRWAEAWGNRSVALLAMHRWDEGIQAAQQALVIKPDYAAAKNNLEWALKHRNEK